MTELTQLLDYRRQLLVRLAETDKQIEEMAQEMSALSASALRTLSEVPVSL